MQMMKWSVMALSIAAATTQLAYADEQDDALVKENLSSQAKSNGFLEDSTLDLLSRNYAFQRDFKNNTSYDAKGVKDSQNMTNEWAQGEMLTYSSGFTQGTVGFGVDAFGYLGIKLNSGKGTTGTGLLSESDDGRAHDEYSKASGAVKLRVSETVAKYGDMRTAAPVFATADSRLLPETATGFNVMSEEISGLVAEAGHYTAYSNRDSSNFDDELATNYSGTTADSISYLGTTYALTDELSTSLYASEVENTWRQYYANINYGVDLGNDQAVGVDFNIYRTNNYGADLAGNIGNTTFSLAPSYTMGAHKFTLAYQQVRGDTPYDYVGGDSIFLAGASQINDFNNAGEKTYKAIYNLDMASFGTPGLTFMASYGVGTGMDNSHDNNGVYSMNDNGTSDDSSDDFRNNTHGGKEWEQNFEAKYVLQEGVAKDLSFRLRESVYRANSAGNNGTGGDDANELRLIVEYPLSIR